MWIFNLLLQSFNNSATISFTWDTDKCTRLWRMVFCFHDCTACFHTAFGYTTYFMVFVQKNYMHLSELIKEKQQRIERVTIYYSSSSFSSSRPSAARSWPMIFFFSSSAFLRIKSLFLRTSVCLLKVLWKFSMDAFFSFTNIFLSSSGSIWISNS